MLALNEAAEEFCWLGLWCLEFPRSRESKLLVRVMAYRISQKPQKKNIS